MINPFVYTGISYTVFFAAAIVFSILINGLLLRFSKTLGTRGNNDNLIRWSSTNKPSFGGISFFIMFLLSILAYTFFFNSAEFFLNIKYLGIFLATALGFLMGLFDDAYNTKVPVKLITQITCGIILIATGTYIHFFELDILNYILTVFWVVGMMNSINMLDNMDGITTLVSLFIFITVFINNIIGGLALHPLNIIMLGMISSLLGFLYYNWQPSKMYMGDTGSQFLGIVLAATGIIYFWNFKEPGGEEIVTKQVVMVALIFLLPITDTTTVFIKRIRAGKSPFIGGKDHTTHHLSYAGLSDRGVALVFAAISAVSMALTLIALHLRTWSHLYTLFFGLYILTVFSVMFYLANKNTPKNKR